MKKIVKGLLAAAVFTVCLAGGAKGTQAEAYQPPCIPGEKELKEYQKDGTLKERMAYYENSAGAEVSESLIKKALFREQGGLKTRSSLPDNWENMSGGMPAEGNAKVLLLHVDFPDEKFEAGDTKEALEEIAFGSNNDYAPYESLTAYYERASYGKLHIDGDVYSYTAENNREFYENDIESLFTEAMRALDDEVDYNQFDGDGDGYLDGVYLHFAGVDSGWGSTWWSITNNSLGQEAFDGVRIGKYVTLHNPSNTKWGAQTLIHETGHVLGLPDFYAPGQDYEGGIKTYDMMYMNTGDYNGFSKWLLGWISEDQVVRITKDNWTDIDSVTLESLSEQAAGDNPKIAVISPEDQGIFSEYFVVEYDTCVENQKALTFNGKALPDGFRVFHVNARLNDGGTGFATGNWSADQTKLIELVDPDEALFHGDIFGDEDGFDQVPGPYDAESYHCKFMEGDSLTPQSLPNSAFEGGKYKGYTGITMESFVTGGEAAGSFSVSFGEESLLPDPEDFELTECGGWLTTDQSNVVMIPFALSMEASILDDRISPVLQTKDGKEIKGRIERLTDSQILFVAEADSLTAGPARVVFPEGYFDLGMGVASREIARDISIAENAEKTGGLSIDFGNSFSGAAAFDGGWYVLMSDENELRLYRIASDGSVHYENLDVSSWEGWIAPGEGSVENIVILSDGTLVFRGNDWLEGTLKLAHIDQEGNLLDDIVKLDRSDYELAVTGDTVKLYRTELYELQELLSVDFKGEPKSVEITDRMRYSTILFTDEGYLFPYYEDRDKSYICFDIYDKNDKLVHTFSYDSENEDMFKGGEFAAAASAEGKLYLFALMQDYEEIWSASDTMYITGEMWCYILDQKTGGFLGRTLVDQQLRLTKNSNSNIGPELVTVSVSDDMMMLHLRNRVDGKYLDDGYFYLADSYFIDLQGNLVSETSSINSMKVSFQSGKLLTAGAWQDGKVEFSIHNAVKDQEDTVKPDPKPDGDKDPGKQPGDELEDQGPAPDKHPAGSKNTDASASQTETQIEKPAKTGDSFRTGIYAVMIIAAGAAAVLVVIKRRNI
ncbi:M6 family metalloprotease domain [uncultured Roseburia sp.]|uniref:M6 family metalloprotease domain-containing protein n=1 Tax=Brotonthovivens ammoniilytica TaxID=2981725 RepID=A0ABT2TN08_9FIRM|nr:M6 family metalloprotease domain-containing protein [Brotonthovivens ammoniilytica]MCU6763597.1 M6 family metalloprotease domain-containing protein [Brotonthovivens ammoniilytica]SCJ26340.1 M6 family metalloprotease domain [uncultured Roseburia sp.]